MQIRDLEQWPPSVWVTTGPANPSPNLATATIKEIHAMGKSLVLSFIDQAQEYKATITLLDRLLARRVKYTLIRGAIGKTVWFANDLVIEEKIQFSGLKK